MSRDFAIEDALTRQLRVNKEKIAARQAELASLKLAFGERDGVSEIGSSAGKIAEWRIGVEQPNPFQPAPPAEISEAVRTHPLAKLRASSTPVQHEPHQRQHHQHQYHNNHQQHESFKGRSALAFQREDQERQFIESRENTRRWSAQIGRPSDRAATYQHNRGISI